MPFQSKAQMRALFARSPALAREFAAGMSKSEIANLPARKGRKVAPRKGRKKT